MARADSNVVYLAGLRVMALYHAHKRAVHRYWQERTKEAHDECQRIHALYVEAMRQEETERAQ